ncbi:dihydrodipicolinate synthase/N-acetylneuraminate lyase [Burkholderia sp. Ch1-1]|uniref:1-pyrroline-4-hydroxy-2-carboxylate deaminase n=1 Tax=Paraburkholderia dioscoreae TaxID=2604047 RepID=A0A5Q4ZCP8_9BURK|nr:MULTISPECIES: dihydrodipicolinate synthase family protein [Paraburkholderia]EIF34057.1 dihydrodipicolinate synthase/N-acetylneuraminate lyase [Burkholderia sp. Ch1-1]MDR8396089.1 dihydrodipicolinate synthase family protein [Paraburkholderia sp. USG1]VVD32969.1 1-pyrroline-4-hydroxy-2-carboxylate deaminase [Paraburkholderia dioscoreae]
MQVNWKGVFPAVTTKLKDDGSLDHEAIKSGLNRLIENGVGGVVMMGMVGENAQLTADEKRTVLKLAVETVAGRVPVISGLAETSTALAVQFAQDAEAIGVQGLMVFPGLTYRSDDRETVEFYRTIARSTKLGLMIYNNPRGYGVDMRPDLMDQLKDEANVVAIKEETYDTTRVTDLLKRFGDRFAVFCGVDDLVLESAALGVTGWVSGMANAMPKESVELLNLAVAGDFVKARELYRALIDLFHLDVHVKLVQYIKLAENMTAGYPENVKAPRLKLEGEERQKVVAIVEQAIANVRALSN